MPLDLFPAYFWRFIPFLVVWEAVWKGIALWRAGGNRQLGWFIALFIVNSIGILPIIYIFAFSKKKESFPQLPK